MILNDEEVSKKNIDLINLEALISTIATRFFRNTDIGKAMNSFLRDIGLLCKINHVYLNLFNETKTFIKDSFEWIEDNISIQTLNFRDIDKVTINWLIGELNHEGILFIPNSSKLYRSITVTDELIKTLNGSSLISPIKTKDNLVGFIGFNNFFERKNWTENDCSLLRISSQIIGNVLERKKIEDKYKESSAKYKRIIENINDLIVIINFKLEIEYINEGASFKLLKYRNGDILGKSCLDFIHPDDVESIIERLNQGVKQVEPIIEIRFRNNEGDWLWFECRGQTFYDDDGNYKWLIISRDITERKLAEERYKSLFENSPNAILLIDFKGIIVDANSTTKKLFGFGKEYFIGKSITEMGAIFNFEIKQYFKKIFQASFKDIYPHPLEIQFKKKENGLIWVETQASIIKQNSKTLVQLLFQDIAEKKKAELLENDFKQKLENEVQSRTRELNEALTQQKLYLDQIIKSSQFKTEFMSTMSHELRTPLNAIIGFTELLIEGVYGPLNQEQLEFTIDIKTSAEHQFDMIQHILDIAKIEAGQIVLSLQIFSLNSMIKQIKSSLRSLYQKKNLKFKIVGIDTEKEIYADTIRFKEILLNLISNAIKFTIEGSITLIVEEKYNQWMIKVRDTGIGIATKDFPLIFKEFKRVESTYVKSVPGTGLGLSLTKRLINLHGGEISFTSVLGIGTTFSFTIPKIKDKEL